MSEPLWKSCEGCAAYFARRSFLLVGAFASVGIEHNKTMRQVADDYFASFHAGNHYERPDTK